MSCLKCGREVGASQVFCDGCLEVMAKHPVKNTTAVVLPKRSDVPTAPKKRPPKPEEVIAKLQKENKRLRRWIWILCFVLLLGAAAAALYKFREPIIENIGRNYKVIR